MFPTTKFDEIYTFLSCPAKLYLKLIGARSEVARGYTKPTVNIHQLGLDGENAIAEGFERDVIIDTPEEIEVKRKKLNKEIDFPLLIQNLINEIDSLGKQLVQNLQQLQIKISNPKITDLAKKMKKDFGIEAILYKVPYTTTPHHLIGEIDFLGLRNKNEFIVIEAKNAKKVSKQDLTKLEYYIYGLPKGYNFTKIQEHVFEFVGQLYPKKIESYMTYLSSYNYLSNGLSNIYYKIDDTISQNELIEKKFEEKYSSINGFLKAIPIINDIIHQKNHFREKVKISKADFLDAIYYILDILSKGVKDGIIVNKRDQSIQETTLEIDFDTAVRKIWSIKRNVNNGNFICEKNRYSCKMCQYEIQCKAKIIEGELFETKSITSIAHQGFSKLNYKCPDLKDILLIGDDPENWAIFAKQLMNSYYIKGSKVTTHELLKPILSESEWGYEEWFARKPRWKSLFNDAMVSKTFEKELGFWKL